MMSYSKEWIVFTHVPQQLLDGLPNDAWTIASTNTARMVAISPSIAASLDKSYPNVQPCPYSALKEASGTDTFYARGRRGIAKHGAGLAACYRKIVSFPACLSLEWACILHDVEVSFFNPSSVQPSNSNAGTSQQNTILLFPLARCSPCLRVF